MGSIATPIFNSWSSLTSTPEGDTNIENTCGRQQGDKDGAYTGGAIGGIIMLVFVLATLRHIVRIVAKQMIGDGRRDQAAWPRYFMLSLCLYFYGIVAVRFSKMNSDKYGAYGEISGAGLEGGASFVGFLVMIMALYSGIKVTNATGNKIKSRFMLPSFLLAWLLHLLGTATSGFGNVHMMTLKTTNPPEVCIGEVIEARDGMYAVVGIFNLVAFGLCVINVILGFWPGEPRKPEHSAFALMLGGYFLLFATYSWMELQANPSKSNRQSAWVIPALVMFAGQILALFILLKQVAGYGVGCFAVSAAAALDKSGAHQFNTCLFTFAMYTGLYAVCLLNRAATMDENLDTIYKNTEGLLGFACFMVFGLFVIVTASTSRALIEYFKSVSTSKETNFLAKLKVPPNCNIDGMWNLFCAGWACLLFSDGVVLGFSSSVAGNLKNAKHPTMDDVNAAFGIAGFALFIGACALLLAAAFGRPKTSQTLVKKTADTPRYDPETGKPITKRNSRSQFSPTAPTAPTSPPLSPGPSNPVSDAV
jgi:hypothetical protein